MIAKNIDIVTSEKCLLYTTILCIPNLIQAEVRHYAVEKFKGFSFYTFNLDYNLFSPLTAFYSISILLFLKKLSITFSFQICFCDLQGV